MHIVLHCLHIVHTHSHTRKQSALFVVVEGRGERGYCNAFFCNNSISRFSLPITHTHIERDEGIDNGVQQTEHTDVDVAAPMREMCTHTDVTALLCSNCIFPACWQGAPAPPHSLTHTYTKTYVCIFIVFFCVWLCANVQRGCEFWAPFPNVTQPCTMRATIAPGLPLPLRRRRRHREGEGDYVDVDVVLDEALHFTQQPHDASSVEPITHTVCLPCNAVRTLRSSTLFIVLATPALCCVIIFVSSGCVHKSNKMYWMSTGSQSRAERRFYITIAVQSTRASRYTLIARRPSSPSSLPHVRALCALCLLRCVSVYEARRGWCLFLCVCVCARRVTCAFASPHPEKAYR